MTVPSKGEAQQPLVSVLIANLNGNGVLPQCLDSLLAQTYKPMEIIVVDNASTDDSADLVEAQYPMVNLMRANRNLGYSGGSNFGARHSLGSYLLLMDSDTVASRSLIEPLVAAMESDPRVGVVQSKILCLDSPNVIDSLGAYFTGTGILFNPQKGELDQVAADSPYEVFSAQGACMMVRADLFRQLGGFDDDYVMFFDDTDLCWRVWLAGYKVKVVPQALIYHQGGGATSSQLSGAVVYHTFKNRLCSLLKNLAPRDMVRVIPLHLFLCLLGSLAFLVRLKPRSALAVVGAIGWNVVSLRRTLEKRRQVAGYAVVHRAALFPRLERKMPLAYLVRGGVKYAKQW